MFTVLGGRSAVEVNTAVARCNRVRRGLKSVRRNRFMIGPRLARGPDGRESIRLSTTRYPGIRPLLLLANTLLAILRKQCVGMEHSLVRTLECRNACIVELAKSTIAWLTCE